LNVYLPFPIVRPASGIRTFARCGDVTASPSKAHLANQHGWTEDKAEEDNVGKATSVIMLYGDGSFPPSPKDDESAPTGSM
jgi:hypothetical protein